MIQGIGFTLAGLLVAVIILALCNPYIRGRPGEWLCHSIGWHIAPKVQEFYGCSMTGQCPRCDSRVLMDSQGNWFSIDR